MRRLILTFVLCFLGVSASAQDGVGLTFGDIQNQLVRVGGIIRSIEGQLQEIDAQLAVLTVKRDALEHDYTERRARMASTLSALTRMGRTPREAVLTRPGGPLQAARTSMLLSDSFPVVEAEAKSFKTLLTDLEKTRNALADESAKAKAARDDLRDKHAQLQGLLNARGQAIASTAQFQMDAKRVADLAKAARTLRDFLSTLDRGQPSAADQSLYTPTPDGEATMPVSGIVRVTYGQIDNIGAKSSGITIETLPGSLVVAPLGGQVRYVGPFRGYGNIVIIAHSGGYYSLLAGLNKISVSVGQTIVSGEPIAILDDASDANPAKPQARKSLYYELRLGGQPVNPSRKLPGLG